VCAGRGASNNNLYEREEEKIYIYSRDVEASNAIEPGVAAEVYTFAKILRAKTASSFLDEPEKRRANTIDGEEAFMPWSLFV
tara:strand:- start:142 stop:387 length:246 start_codon:yes stop_codon:yes gene_type:complete